MTITVEAVFSGAFVKRYVYMDSERETADRDAENLRRDGMKFRDRNDNLYTELPLTVKVLQQ